MLKRELGDTVQDAVTNERTVHDIKAGQSAVANSGSLSSISCRAVAAT
jgi:hypothetical protein